MSTIIQAHSSRNDELYQKQLAFRLLCLPIILKTIICIFFLIPLDATQKQCELLKNTTNRLLVIKSRFLQPQLLNFTSRCILLVKKSSSSLKLLNESFWRLQVEFCNFMNFLLPSCTFKVLKIDYYEYIKHRFQYQACVKYTLLLCVKWLFRWLNFHEI